MTARDRGFFRAESGVSGALSVSGSAVAAVSTSESRLVSESLIEAVVDRGGLPIGVAATIDEKYFSCSRLVDVSPPEEPEKQQKSLFFTPF